MSKYAELATRAVGFMLWEPGTDPREAWRRAGEEVFPNSVSAQEKGCPKSTFLGFCEEGLIPGAPPGSYTRSVLNKEYGIRGLEAVREDPSLLDDDHRLWEIASNGSGISSNYQMDVLRGLWNRHLIR